MSFLATRRLAAIEQVRAWVETEIPNARRLSGAQLLALGRNESWDGWRLPIPGSEAGSLNLLLDAEFPYSLPRFSLNGRSDLLRAPHMEAGGRLCLAGDGGRADTLDPVAVVKYSHREALALIAEDEAGGNRDDYLLDFDAYWRRDVTRDFLVRTWLRPEARSRALAAWHGQEFYLVAENTDDCRTWLNNLYGVDDTRTFKDAVVIWLDRLPEPHNYPDDAGSLRRLVAERSPDGLSVFDRLMTTMIERATVVLTGATSAGEIAQAPAVIEDPNVARASGKAPKPSVSKGFRPGHVPSNILSVRRSACRVAVERVDAWQGRMRAGEGAQLVEKRVAVLGCGSVGAGVAKLLLQSGLGRAVLVDPDNFAWANVGRHELGANSIGKNKAAALADQFRPMYPHAREVRAEPLSWQSLLRREPDALRGCDLVLSLIGDWNAESALNDLQRSGTGGLSSPVLYGWLEEQAGAAHALAIGCNGACLRCGFGATGTIRIPATAWRRKGPVACGGPTSIYGAIELAPAQAAIASLALDLLLGRCATPVRRAWLAPQPVLEHGGGYWHPSWVDRFGDPGRGGVLTATPWPEDPECPCPHHPATSPSRIRLGNFAS